MKKAAKKTPAKKEKTKSTPVWLDEEQREWLRKRPQGISGTIRSLVFEAMNLENLARSVKKRRK
jgi:hypothetical protein